MGTWGNSFLENDDALDLAAIWEDFVAPHIDASQWDGEKGWDFFRRVYFHDAINTHDPIDNAELLAISVLFQRHDLTIVPELTKFLELCIGSELQPDVLAEWESPKDRKKVLMQLLKQIGGSLQKLSPENNAAVVSTELEALKPFADRLDEWSRVVSPPHVNEDFENLYPAFLYSIERLLTSGMRVEASTTIKEYELIKLRFMTLAFYAAWKAELSADEITVFVKKAEKTKGHFFMALTSGA